MPDSNTGHASQMSAQHENQLENPKHHTQGIEPRSARLQTRLTNETQCFNWQGKSNGNKTNA